MVIKNDLYKYLLIVSLTMLMFILVFGILKGKEKVNLGSQNNSYNMGNRKNSSYIIEVNEKDINLLARAVYSEARGESLKGQVAVAAVIINRVKSPSFPNTIEEVIFQPWAFTAVHDGQFWLQPDSDAFKAVRYALNGWDPVEKALFYYNPVKVTSNWIYSRPVLGKIGKHVFAQ